jgi:hypothetical protein
MDKVLERYYLTGRVMSVAQQTDIWVVKRDRKETDSLPEFRKITYQKTSSP